MNRRVLLFVLGAAVSLAAGLLPKPGETVALLLPAGGEPPDDASGSPALASSGRAVAFLSKASNLIAADADGVRDVLVVDLPSGAAECASVSTDGSKANADCSDPALDRRGRLVAFASLADNLVPDDANLQRDVFVRDRKTGVTRRVSVSSAGAEADGHSEHPRLSGNGRLLVFSSVATNLVEGDTNDDSDVFLRDLLAGQTTRLSLSQAGAQAGGGSLLPEISSNGRFVAFMSHASNITPDDTNPSRDVFVRDLKTGAVEQVSVTSDELCCHAPCGAMTISGNGRRVVFESDAIDLDGADAWVGGDIFVRDRKLGTTTLLSGPLAGAQADGDSFAPALSANGRWVVFTSLSSQAVEGDGNGVADVFRRDLKTGAVERISVSSEGSEGHADSVEGQVSRDGRLVAFSTRADDLVEGAGNGVALVALRRP
jgi:TolB protein